MKQYTKKAPLAGYWIDAKDTLTPEHLVKDIDKERDRLVGEIVEAALVVNRVLREFKTKAHGDIQAFIDLSGEKYGAIVGGKKGNVTLPSYDGAVKVQRALHDRLSFNERMQAAKELIDACIADWTEGASSEIHAIINAAFNTDKSGEINTARVLSLRRYDIQDPRWLQAMDAISESVQVISSKSYIRVYRRVGDTDEFEPIPLDIAGV